MILDGPITPPRDVLLDLLKRQIQVQSIGHLPLPDDLLFRLADQVDEALLTLAKRRYVGAQYDTDQFEEVLHGFPNHEWMLSSLPGLTPSCREKAAVLARHIRAFSEPERCLRWRSPIFEEVWAQNG